MTTSYSRALALGLCVLLAFTVSFSHGAGVAYSTIQTMYTAKCVGCHGAGGSGGLDLRSPQSYGNTVNVASAGHAGTFRVRPNFTSQSYIYTVVVTMQGHNGAATTFTEQQNLSDWINQGALQNLNPPTVTNVSPANGGAAGGTSVTITGTNFGGRSTFEGTFVPVVTFGGVAATNVAVTTGSFTQITCTAPAHAAGAVDVVVATTAGGASAPLANGFTFTGPPTLGSPTSASVTASSATLGGTVVSDGGSAITQRGIVYAVTTLNSNPQIGGANVTTLVASGSQAVFTASAIDLSPGTSYSFKAFATNSLGTSYTSPASSFTTSAGLPSLNGATATSITSNSATLGSEVTGDGGFAITTRGFVYSVTGSNSNPQIGGPGVTTVSASGTGALFTANLSSLAAATSYSFKAFATNSVGTTYTTPASTFTTNPVTGPPTLNAPTVGNVTTSSATLGGNVTGDGGSAVTSRGIVYAPTATNSDPLIGGPGVSILSAGSGTGTFSAELIGLSPATPYSFRVFATNSTGTGYTSPVSSFATTAVGQTAPVITAPTTSSITPNSSVLGGTVTSDGGAAIITRGVVFAPTSTNSNPLIGAAGVMTLTAPGTTGIFTVSASGLSPNTSYSFKAFATNSVGTTYTTPVSSFSTSPASPTAPAIADPTSANVTGNSATLGGNVTSDGGAAITTRGIVFAPTSTNSNPVIGGAGVTALAAPGTVGVFTVSAAGLTAGTSYSFKAFATNSVGTTYTAPVATFTTSSGGPTPPSVSNPTVANLTANSATLGGNVTSDGGTPITTRGVIYSIPSVNNDPLIGGIGVTRLPAAGTLGVFTVEALALPPDTPYVFKAYAINSAGTTYSPAELFTTLELGIPPNDNFDSAQILPGGSGNITSTNANASIEIGEPNHADREGGQSVWFKWIAPDTGTVSFDAFDSDFDTLLAVYTGASVDALTLVKSNDDARGMQSRVSFITVAGTTYYIAVDGFEGAAGEIGLRYYPGSVPVRGTYLGLVESAAGGTTGFSHARSGFVRLTVMDSTEFTGSLVYAGQTVRLRGSFGGQVGGSGPIDIPHYGEVTLSFSGEIDAIVGTLHDETAGGTSTILLHRNVYEDSENPAPQAGAYTLQTQPGPVSLGQSTIPQGFGHGKVTVKADGTATIIGRLGDGTGFSVSSGVSKLGALPLYALIYKKLGSVQGVASFGLVEGVSDAQGTLKWFKPALNSERFYPEGFNTALAYLLSTFVPPERGERIIPAGDSTGNLLITLTEGGIAPIPPFTVTLDDRNHVIGNGDIGFRMKISRRSGAFQGAFIDPSTKHRRSFSGSIFQRQGNGGGYFKGDGQTGAVKITTPGLIETWKSTPGLTRPE